MICLMKYLELIYIKNVYFRSVILKNQCKILKFNVNDTHFTFIIHKSGVKSLKNSVNNTQFTLIIIKNRCKIHVIKCK
jgi:hypothetical protein